LKKEKGREKMVMKYRSMAFVRLSICVTKKRFLPSGRQGGRSGSLRKKLIALE